MGNIREITLFSVGDANELRSWSNVPYFFSKSLLEKGIKVNLVNIEEDKTLEVIYKYTFQAFFKIICRNSRHTYFRSGINNYFTKKKIKKALEHYKDSQVKLFLTFSFSTVGLEINKPTVLFGDWTYLYYIKNFLGREPMWFEKKALQREAKNIDHSKLTLALFPVSAKFIKANQPKSKCHYLGNVINANYSFQKDAIIEKKLKSKKIIFIGNQKYLEGAKKLIECFPKIKNSQQKTELHLIGLSEKDTGKDLPGLYQHGYLDKGDKLQNEKYYQLLSDAALMVNTNEGWGAFSAVTEAMYFCTPVITTPYNEFTETFGKEISFGDYIENHTEEDLAELIVKNLDLIDEQKKQMMQKAHESVKDFTWEAYTDKVLELITPMV